MYPNIIKGYCDNSYLKRSLDEEDLYLNIIDQRKLSKQFSEIYDAPFGGGPGQIMRVDNFHKTMEPYLKDAITIIFSPRGRTVKQKDLYNWAKSGKEINLVCPRFEGYDIRIEKFCDEVISLGDFVISGGELPALIIIEGMYRLNSNSKIKEANVFEDSFGIDGSSEIHEYDQYTRPREFKGKKVPDVLVGGNHATIKKWREDNQNETLKNKKSINNHSKPNQNK